MRTGETPCRSILVRSKLPDTDLVANLYVGCAFGCTYCYASFMARQVNEPRTDWGKFVYAKRGALDAARRDLDRLKRRGATPSILLSSVTDPYQGIERKLQLTRGFVSELARRKYEGRLSILTKSPMVLRDAGVLSDVLDVEVGLTVTLGEDPISRELEAHAPSIAQRLDTLRRLAEGGPETYAFVGPVPPHIVDDLDQIDALLSSLREAGVRSVFVEHLNASHSLRARIAAIAEQRCPASLHHYLTAPPPATIDAITRYAEATARKHGLVLRTGKVIQHESTRRMATITARSHETSNGG